ncbi:NAD(P)/FAD-dependent oxidoreductase [Candidatus Woesearchaeota archaeon]|nr:NAD(P)/FAD-dependent oxidoreductase [Candidatus Woesearchaeota archaeon]
MEVTVIGSGTIGGYAAYLLAKDGHKVSIYEDHEKIGIPCHCTGIITSSFLEMVKLREGILLNTLSKVKIFSPDGRCAVLRCNDIVVDRIKLDEFFTQMAVDAGAELIMGNRLREIDMQKKKICLENKNGKRTISYRRLVAADGPNSRVFTELNPGIRRRHWLGAQAVIRGRFDREMYEVYLNNDYCKGFFAWVVPESGESAIAGLAVSERPSFHFEKFMKRRFGDGFKKDISGYRGGLIPCYDPGVNCRKGDVCLVGDAGLHVKATTGGGIIPGMKAAQALAESFRTGEDYENLWRKKTGFNLWSHLRIRKMLDRFTDADYNYLVMLMGTERARKIMADSDREYPKAFALKLLMAEPRLLYFMKHLF